MMPNNFIDPNVCRFYLYPYALICDEHNKNIILS